ncbi:MAG: RNA polymerase sigma factor [Clostridia bacterium]|nr:RNA polymerase sigma factor [Clostridia bacterium]
MIDFDKAFAKECEEYLLYVSELAARKYGDCPDMDSLIQDSIMALLERKRQGVAVQHPKGFLAAVLQNKYNAWLRQKYKNNVLSYECADIPQDDALLQKEEAESRDEEYTAVRRELGRLIRIYREVAVRYYVHGHSVEKIASDLHISAGTVKSRLSSARDQIREGLEMEKYAQVSYEPKKMAMAIWGSCGLSNEPFSLLHSDLEPNILLLAYENPVSVRGIADTMGMPTAYIEPLIDKLVEGELMGRTDGGLVYTRCFIQQQSESFGDIPRQEALADKYAETVWQTVWKHLEPLMVRAEFASMSEKQKATLCLFVMHQTLADVVRRCKPKSENEPKQPPERPNAGRWLATGTILDAGPKQRVKYASSGPVQVAYSKNNDGRYACRMFDCQSLFGDAHWAYNTFKYKCSLQSILRFYASFLPCDVETDNKLLHELIPEFEKLCILKRGGDGEVALDIPALTFEEARQYLDPAMAAIREELYALLHTDLEKVWVCRKNRVPKHVDQWQYYLHIGAMDAYAKAQMLAIVQKDLLPYPVTVGKTPIIFVVYEKKEK